MNTSTSGRSCSVRRGAWALCAVLLVLPYPASASLGGDVSSVQVDRAQMKASLQVASAAGYAVHEMRLPGGTRVREYVSPDGTVFGVAWKGPFRPDLRQLLGGYFDRFEEAALAARSARVGRGPILIDRPDLVVHLGGRAHAFVGQAYIPARMPADVSASDIQ